LELLTVSYNSVFAFDYSNITHKTTSTDPRLAYRTDEKANNGEIRQRFDASTNACQVLQGRDLTGLHAIVTGANSGIGVYLRFLLLIPSC
jgi:hypothetical protein